MSKRGHPQPERLDGRDDRGRFQGLSAERAGAAKLMGRTLTPNDYQALKQIQQAVRGYWAALVSEVDIEGWRAIIQARVNAAKADTPQGLKNAELLFRYLLGDKAPSGEGQRTRLEVLVAAVLKSPLVASEQEAEAIEIVAERTWLPADSGAVADPSASVSDETGGGRGESREVSA